MVPQKGKIKIHSEVSIGLFQQSNIQLLNDDYTIEEEISQSSEGLTRTEIRQICGLMLFEGTQAQKKIKVLSGGEKARVSLGKVLAKPHNILLLDEPSQHLDPESVESLINAIKSFPGAIVFVSHDEHIINEIAEELVVFEDSKNFFFNGNYFLFLQEKGWSIESPTVLKKTKSKTLHYQKTKEEKKQSQILSRDLQKLEKKITQKEFLLLELEESIAQAYQEKSQDKAQKILQKIGKTKTELDVLFSKLENF